MANVVVSGSVTVSESGNDDDESENGTWTAVIENEIANGANENASVGDVICTNEYDGWVIGSESGNEFGWAESDESQR